MNLNLVTDAWLPAVDGNTIQRITPLDLLRSDHEQLAYAQPDLGAAAVELLVCMAQTAVPPTDEDEWRSWMKRGTFPDDLEERWNRLAPAFFVRHDERPFMQDPSLDASKPKRIELLDATRSPDHAVNEGRALFAQPDDGYRLPADEAALRVWIYQTLAPIASRRKGPYRGYGALSTLVRLPTLRQTVIANLLPAANGNPLDWVGWGGRLPDASEQPHLEHKNHTDPRSPLWITPGRVLLVFEGDQCTGFATGSKRGDHQYTAPHPHSPGRFDAKGKWVATQGTVLGRGYPALLHLLMDPAKAQKKEVEPALVVSNYHRQGDWGLPEARMWAYGYHVDNNVDGWNETTAPIVEPDQVTRDTIDRVLGASETILKSLWRACYEVIKDDVPDRDLRPNDKNLPFSSMRDRYHRATEAAFWNVVETKSNRDEATDAWQKAALGEAHQLLEEWVSGYPETRLAGRVRARHVMDGLRWRKELNISTEES